MSSYLKAALAIGEDLAGAPQAGSGIWTGDTLQPDGNGGHVAVPGLPTGFDLYGGSAGIGWSLAHLARASSARAMEGIAGAALEAALAGGEFLIESASHALYSGAAGIALATYEGGVALGRDDLKLAGAALMRKVAQAAPDDSSAEVDLIGGRAGVIVALMALDRQMPDDVLRGSAARLCELLIETSRDGWWGIDWPGPSGSRLCGLAHGASGIAWALIDTGERLGDVRFIAAGHSALRYENGWFDSMRGTWPDLRTRNDNPSAALGWMDAWCHGALGIGAVRWHLWERSHDPQLLAQATAAMWAVRRQVVAAAQATPGQIADMTLCHGLAGAAELMLLAHEASGRAEHLQAARRVGSLILRLREANGGQWTVGLPGGNDVPGLMLGRAGIASLMLRLHDPLAIGSSMLAGRRARNLEDQVEKRI